MVDIVLSGDTEFMAALRGMSDDVMQAVSRAVEATGLELRGDIIKSVNSGPASGRVYQKYKPRRTHRASAPDQAPMTDTGRLVNSIVFDRDGPLTVTVGSNLVYALYLEYGTRKMAARPYFRPAVDAVRDKFVRRLNAAIYGAMK